MQTQTTTTTTTTTATQNNTQLVVGANTSSVSLGDNVTDVSLQPYIAPTVIAFVAYNIRPNCRVHMFFDSTLVDQYCAPGVLATDYASRDTSDPYIVTRTGAWGDPVFSDSTGKVYGHFAVPASTFKTGDRAFEICDVTSIAQGNSAITTAAFATFTASNLSVTKQNVTLTTINASLSVANVVNSIVSTNTSVTSINLPSGGVELHLFPAYDPIAQIIPIKTPNGEAGVFATSITVYFQQKSSIPGNGVSLYLVETQNALPNGSVVLPFSMTHLNNSQINVSSDATVGTKFTFESPVFMNNGLNYAFVVKPDGNDPDYHVFFARLGDIDITTGGQVYGQPVQGTACISATGNTWTALQDEYIKYDMGVANFTMNNGTAVFNNTDTDYLKVSSISYANSSAGILPGDRVFRSGNTLPATVNAVANGVLSYYNSDKGVFYIDSSTGNFSGSGYVQIHRSNTATFTPNTTTFVAAAQVASLYNPILDAAVPQFATMTPAGTGLNFSYHGTANSYATDSTDLKVNSGIENEFFDQERIVASKSAEVANMGGAKSSTVKTQFISDSPFLSPMIDMAKSNELIICNDIDPISFQYDELYNYGNAKTKYISQIITLAEGQDAEDLQIILSAFRPFSSDILVYAKFLNSEDSETMTQKIWTPLWNKASGLYSDFANPNDFKEFTFAVSSSYKPLPLTGTITTSSNTVTGTSTLFTTQLKNGMWINCDDGGSSRQVVAIANNTSLTLSSAFAVSKTSANAFMVTPPFVAYSSKQSSIQVSGTVSANTTTNIVTGSGTSFLTSFKPGDVIQIGPDAQVVVSVANNTSLQVGTAWTSVVSSANVYNETTPGLTYLNTSYNKFTGYKQFQIKIVLQSDDTSKVPIIDNLRALAMQL